MGRKTSSRIGWSTSLIIAIVIAATAITAIALAGRRADKAKPAASATTTARLSSAPVPPEPVTEVGTRTAGIDFKRHDGPFGSAGFHVDDIYQGPINGTWYLVFAGQKNPYERPSGALRIYSGPVDIAEGAPVDSVGDFAVPGASDLEVTSVERTTLHLVDPSTRHPYLFDLGTLQFTR